MGHCAGPHDLGPGVVVVRLGEDAGRRVDDRGERGLDETVGELDGAGVGEVALEEMGYDVRDTVRDLGRVKTSSGFRIEKRG
jgi:hypothetical protein